jgi:hypothetical protein
LRLHIALDQAVKEADIRDKPNNRGEELTEKMRPAAMVANVFLPKRHTLLDGYKLEA